MIKELSFEYVGFDIFEPYYRVDLTIKDDEVLGEYDIEDLTLDIIEQNKISLKDNQYHDFVNKLNSLNLEKWEKEVSNPDTTYYHSYLLAYKTDDNKRKKELYGIDIYPDNFNDFIDCLALISKHFLNIKRYAMVGPVYGLENEDEELISEEDYDKPMSILVPMMFDRLISQNLIDEELLTKLQDEVYCHEIFNSPKILATKEDMLKNHNCYFKKPYHLLNGDYYLCNSLEDNESDKCIFLDWCNTIINHRKKI